jgi:hypothetical protein
MKVKKVSLLNIDDLYKAVLRKQNDQDYKFKHFAMNYPQLLSHMSISFELEEVSMIEYIFLKNYVRNTSPFKKDTEVNFEYLTTNYQKMMDSSIIPFYTLIKNLNDEFRDKTTDMMTPLGFVLGSTTVVLSGEAITLVTGLDPILFFLQFKKTLDITEELSQENLLHPEMESELFGEKFINFVISNFFNNFYKFMLDKIMYIDPASDAYNHSFYLNKYKNGATLASVRSYDFMINFLESDPSSIMETLNEFKVKHTLENNLSVLESVKLEIGMNTDLLTFFTLYNALPLDRFTSIESFIAVNNSSNTIYATPAEYAHQQYGRRCISRINVLKEDIKKFYSNTKEVLKQFSLTFGYAKIRYTIQISLLDYLLYIDNMKISHLDNNEISNIESLKNWCKAIKDKVI